ncbi:MAG: Rieske 2Fe-2S domain-containing protein [Nitrososphaerota archaeon]|nr:Rieske 2Fe-2S domain-containing protein [Nitrososphaerota archaeon]
MRPPTAAPAPRPAAPTPPPRPSVPKNEGRRTFAKAIVALGAVLSLVPFVPWGTYLSSSVSSTGAYKRQKVVLDLNTKANGNTNGPAAGKTVNVNDLTTFPPNSTFLLTYPTSGDTTVDSQNPDTFVKFGLIRLPAEMGGSGKSASAFVAFSKVCVHLWCSPTYDPAHSTNPSDETYQCPCHGSIYRIPDGLSIAGPASLQPPPTNAIPMLTLTADSDGTLNIEAPLWDVEHNGVIGYGRDYKSYDTYIKPAAGGSS